MASLVPKLPASPDGVEELHALDQRIELHRDEPELEIMLLLERAWVRDRLEDYRDALQRSADWVAQAPNQRRAWQTRAQVAFTACKRTGEAESLAGQLGIR